MPCGGSVEDLGPHGEVGGGRLARGLVGRIGVDLDDRWGQILREAQADVVGHLPAPLAGVSGNTTPIRASSSQPTSSVERKRRRRYDARCNSVARLVSESLGVNVKSENGLPLRPARERSRSRILCDSATECRRSNSFLSALRLPTMIAVQSFLVRMERYDIPFPWLEGVGEGSRWPARRARPPSVLWWGLQGCLVRVVERHLCKQV